MVIYEKCRRVMVHMCVCVVNLERLRIVVQQDVASLLFFSVDVVKVEHYSGEDLLHLLGGGGGGGGLRGIRERKGEGGGGGHNLFSGSFCSYCSRSCSTSLHPSMTENKLERQLAAQPTLRFKVPTHLP